MKIFIIIIAYFFICVSTLCAQVGINSQSPHGAFDVRVVEGVGEKGLVVTDNGTVIIGQSTSTSEDARLVVEGSMMIRTGQEGHNKYYSIDDLGVMDWHNITLGTQYSVWRLSNPGFYFALEDNNILTGTSELSINDIGMTVGTNSLFLPQGKYLITTYGDVLGNEVCNLYLYQIDNGQILLQQSYFGYLSGATTYLEVNNSIEVGLRLYFNDKFDHSTFYPRQFFYQLTFLQLVD